MGYFSRYKSDKYGFNNPNNSVWDKSGSIEYMIIGDSFAHGNCVNEKDTIAGNLRAFSNKNIINIGYGGSGPLIEYARLKEYFPKEKRVKKILWLFCGENDLMDLKIEIKQEILKNYLFDKNFNQNLITKTNIIDKELKIFHSKILNRWKEESKLINFLKLQRLRWYILYYLPKNYDYETFKKIMMNANEFAKEQNSELFFVYIASDSFVNTKTMFRTEREKVTKIINELNIPIIDIYDELFTNEMNVEKFFPPNKKGHYNPLGNQEVAKIIYKKTNSLSPKLNLNPLN
jgi:lysophospholipase L1-like esterase